MELTQVADFFVFQIVRKPEAAAATTDIVALMACTNTYHILRTPDEDITEAWLWYLLILQTKSG
jgi:hypothetical protein